MKHTNEVRYKAMKNPILVFGLLMSVPILATEVASDIKRDEMPDGCKSKYKEMPVNDSFRQILGELAAEKEISRDLSKKSFNLVMKYREALLFNDTQLIHELLSSEPYKTNAALYYQSQQRIADLEKQLGIPWPGINYSEEEYTMLQRLFQKPKVGRWGSLTPSTQLLSYEPR